MRYRALMTVVLITLLGVGCTGSSYDQLDYRTFDLTPGQGWRSAAAEGRYREASVMIEEYLGAHGTLPAWQLTLLHFHAGQMYASDGDYEGALAHLNASVDSEPAANLSWNAYVNATMAFLKKDLEMLERYREELARGPMVGEVVPHLDVVDALVENFDQPYATAYESFRTR